MIQYVLLGGQVLTVALIYLFVWRVIRSAQTNLRNSGKLSANVSSQESTIMPAASVTKARRAAGLRDPRLVVEESDVLRAGVPFTITSSLSIGRSPESDIVLDEGIVSATHARIIPPGAVIDEGSTNGTYINALAVKGRVTLNDGDILQIGSTVFRYEGVK